MSRCIYQLNYNDRISHYKGPYDSLLLLNAKPQQENDDNIDNFVGRGFRFPILYCF